MILRCYAVLASVSRCYSTLEGRLVTCYSPGRHFTQGLLPFLVRLACVRHAASVDSEPGSNSRLKPDVCRRVVGRLPSPGSKAGMAPLFSFSLLQIEIRKRAKTTVVYLVRSFELMLESVSHDWHVQPSCQRPNHDPPERREFSPGGFFSVSKPTSANPTVLETLQAYGGAQNPVNRRVPQDFQTISTAGPIGKREQESCLKPESRFLAGLSARFGMTSVDV